MKLENSNFESNARQSLSTFDKLKNAFKFGNTSGLDKASASMDKLNKSSKGITLDKLRGALDTVTSKFSTLGVIGTTALMNITNRAVNAGLSLAKSLSIEPIMDGFREYELKMGSIQTVLANTAKDGTTLKDVNAVLNDLNTYADKTIYNFAEMTRNIGTFTAAGVKLGPAKDSIKGIANLAALSGSNSQQASTAMYQLSQAIAAGSVKLQDWNSVVNAGMGGQVFQDALKETARAHGVAVDAMIEKNGSFRESLQEGWVTSEILVETLSKFTGDLSDAQLKQMGYTDQQIKDIQKMAQMAVDSATKVRTFTQLMDTAKEAVGSTWASFWEYMIGDFDKATDRLTKVSQAFENFISNMMDPFINKVKSLSEMGFIDRLWDSMFRGAQSVGKIFGAVGKAFREIFPRSTIADSAKVIKNFENLTKALQPSQKTLNNIKDAFKGVFSVAKLGIDVIKRLGKFFLDLIPFEMSGSILDVAGALGRLLQKATDSARHFEGFSKLLDSLSGGFKKIYGWIDKVINKFMDTEGPMSAITSLFNNVLNIIRNLGQKITDVFRSMDFRDWTNTGIVGILILMGKKALEAVKSFKSVGDAAKELIENVGFKGFFDQLKEGMDKIVGDDGLFSKLGDTLNAFQQQVQAKTLMKIAISVGILAASLALLNGIDGQSMAKSLLALGAGLSGLMYALHFMTTKMDLSNTKGLGKGVMSMIGFATSLVIIAGALRVLNGMEPKKLLPSVIAMGALMAEMAVAQRIMAKVPSGGVKMMQFIGLATSMLILVKALQPLAQMDIKSIIKSIVSMGALMAEMAVFAHVVATAKVGVGAGLAMISFATSLVIMSKAVSKISDLDIGSLLKGMGAITAMLAEIAIFSKVLNGKNLTLSSVGLIALAGAMALMVPPVFALSKIPFAGLVKGLGALAVLMGEFALASKLIGPQGLVSAAAIAAMAVSVALLTPPLLLLGSVSLATIGKGLLAIAGAFTVFGVAGALLAPVAPAMLAVAGAFTLLGAAMLMFGKGLSLAAAAIAEVKIVGAVQTMVLGMIQAMIESIPKISAGFVQMLVQTLQEVVKAAPQLIEGVVQLIVAIINGVADAMPRIAEAVSNLINGIFDAGLKLIQDVPIEKLAGAIIAVGAISVVAKMVVGLGAILPQAIAGIASAGVLIGEVALVLAAIGLLTSIPGVQDFVDRGGDMLQSIGTAIGKFVGGLVGGVLEGASASLPNIATNLTNFMNNAKGFINGANSIEPGSMEGVKELSKAILVITAANLLNGINNFLSIFGGGSSMDTFGRELTSFGRAMRSYGQSVSGLDTAAIVMSAKGAKGLVDVARQIPNMGGALSFLVGDNKMGDFGREIVKFGRSLKSYSNAVTGIDIASIQSSVSATKSLVQVTNSLGNSGGLISLFAGDNTLDKFGKQLVKYSKQLKDFSINVASIDTSKMSGVASTTKQLNSAMSGVKSNANIETFGKQLVSFGKSLKKFFDNASRLNTGNVLGAISTVKKLTAEVNRLGNIPTGKVNALANAIKKVGTDSINQIKRSFTSNQGSVNNTVGKFLTSMANYAKSRGSNLMNSAGKTIINKFISGMNSRRGAVSSAARSLANAAKSPLSRVSLYRYGVNAGQGFANGMSSRYGSVYSAAARLARAASNAVRANLRIHSPSRVMMQLADYTVQGFTNNLEKGESATFTAASKMAKGAVTGVQKLAKDFGKIVDSEFAYSPEITPVVNWGGAGTMPTTSMPVLATAGAGTLSMTTRLATTASSASPISKSISASTVNSYSINNEKMLDGAVFHVREEADIPKIAREINRLERESLESEGIRL